MNWLQHRLENIILITMLGLFFTGMFVSYAPYQYWGEYKNIEYVGKDTEGKLTFLSETTIYRPVKINWHDELYCDLNDGLGIRFYSSQTDTSKNYIEPYEHNEVIWTYLKNVPENGTCYLNSTISYSNNFLGIQLARNQTFITEEFEL